MKSSEPCVLAIDLGTTTIAASLLDQRQGVRLATTGALNPQREFGADVISRLDAACTSAESLNTMTRLINRELERLAAELLDCTGRSPESLAGAAVAGNPAMEHLLLGLPVESLAFPPYRPLFAAGRSLDTGELNWSLHAPAYIFPLPGGFVGGDLLAFLFGCNANNENSNQARLYLDLGTNGEIALCVDKRIYATSAAAGPAFEGGNLACGMAAVPGAISGVSFAGDRVELDVIGGARPRGICGSAVIDTVGALVRAGVLDPTGRLRTAGEIGSNLANRITDISGEPAFILYRDAGSLIYLGQQDIRQVQLAKGAIRAGIEVLLDRSALSWEAVQEVVVTGSFGAVLTPGGLKNVGVLPEKMIEVCSFVREGALAGVESMLALPDGRQAVDRLADMVKVVPLSGTPAFEKHFLAQMNFPPMQDATQSAPSDNSK